MISTFTNLLSDEKWGMKKKKKLVAGMPSRAFPDDVYDINYYESCHVRRYRRRSILSRLHFLPSSSFLFNTHLIRARPSSNVVERRWIVPCAAFQSFGFLQTFLQHYFVRRRFLLLSFLPAFDSRNSLVLPLVIMPCASCSRPPSKLLDDYLTTPVLSSSCWASQKGKATQGIGTVILTLRDEWHLNLSWLLHSRKTHVV